MTKNPSSSASKQPGHQQSGRPADPSLLSVSLLTVALVILVVGLPVTATASPWLVDEDEVVLTGRFDHQWADSEFLSADNDFVDEPYKPRPYPLEGRYQSSTFVTQARVGLLEDVELSISIPIKSVSYKSDPVVLLPGGDGAGLDYYQQNVIDLSQQVTGLSDIRYGIAYQLFTGRIAGSLNLVLKTPTGYRQPAGTFGREPTSEEVFTNNPGEFVTPDNVEDDVTLGDGQTDVTASFQWGWALPSRTFVRANAGYALRLGGAADELQAGLQVGQALGESVLLTAGADFISALQDGDSVGLSVAADDPDLPAEEYGGLNNIALRQTPLERDRLTLRIGTILRVTEDVETTISYSRTVWGQNTAASQTLSLGTGVRFDIADTSKSDPPPASSADGQTDDAE
jgi:hypothetical protein